MVYIKLVRYLLGNVKFKAQGYKLSGLVNTRKNNIHIWDIKNINGEFEGYTFAHNYRKLAKLSKNLGIKVRVVEKRGLPFKIRPYRKRIGLLVGLGIFALFLIFTQFFVWSIQINGCDEKTKQYVLEEMRLENIKIGSFIPDMELENAREKILARSNNITWLTFNLKGTKIYVELTQKDMLKTVPEEEPCNIVAKKAGIILSVNAYEGNKAVGINEVVNEGDLLVNGVIEDSLGNVRYVHSKAKIIAQTQRSHTITFALNNEEKIYTQEEKNRYILNFFGIGIPCYITDLSDKNCDVDSRYSSLVLFGKEMPFGITKTSYRFFDIQKKEYTQKEAKDIILNYFKEYEKTELCDVEIVKEQKFEKVSNGVYSITKEYTCCEDIAKEIKIYVNQ